MRRQFHIHTVYPVLDDDADADRGRPLVHYSIRVVGSGNGRVRVVDPHSHEEIVLVSPTRDYHEERVHKVVFAPKPNNDWTVVALYNNQQVAYTHGNVDKEWKTVDVVTGNTDCILLDIAYDPAVGNKVYLLDSRGGMHVLRLPRAGHNSLELALVERLETLVINADPSAAYAPSYDVASPVMITKHIFFCHGILYQVWKNNSCNVCSGTGYFRMSANEIFVLRYDHRRSLCWDAVRDLGGCSMFACNKSSPAVVRAGAVPGIRADCVYWIDLKGVPMVCDIATGSSKTCVLPYGACEGNCWYFGDDNTMR